MDDLTQAAKTLFRILTKRGQRASYGQFGEDAIIQSLLKGQTGTYIDVGAYQPVLYSNTYALYRKGWHGYAIDPNSRMRLLFALFRPRDTFIQAAIGESGTRHYHAFDDEAYNTLDDAEAEKRKQMPQRIYKGATALPVAPLSSIIAENAIREIHFLNIDVEGMDLHVLRSHDWTVRPKVIAVEVDGFDPSNPFVSDTYTYLHEKGYRLVGFSRLTLIWSSNQ